MLTADRTKQLSYVIWVVAGIVLIAALGFAFLRNTHSVAVSGDRRRHDVPVVTAANVPGLADDIAVFPGGTPAAGWPQKNCVAFQSRRHSLQAFDIGETDIAISIKAPSTEPVALEAARIIDDRPSTNSETHVEGCEDFYPAASLTGPSSAAGSNPETNSSDGGIQVFLDSPAGVSINQSVLVDAAQTRTVLVDAVADKAPHYWKLALTIRSGNAVRTVVVDDDGRPFATAPKSAIDDAVSRSAGAWSLAARQRLSYWAPVTRPKKTTTLDESDASLTIYPASRLLAFFGRSSGGTGTSAIGATGRKPDEAWTVTTPQQPQVPPPNMSCADLYAWSLRFQPAPILTGDQILTVASYSESLPNYTLSDFELADVHSVKSTTATAPIEISCQPNTTRLSGYLEGVSGWISVNDMGLDYFDRGSPNEFAEPLPFTGLPTSIVIDNEQSGSYSYVYRAFLDGSDGSSAALTLSDHGQPFVSVDVPPQSIRHLYYCESSSRPAWQTDPAACPQVKSPDLVG